MIRNQHGLGIRGQMPGRAGKSWWSAPSHMLVVLGASLTTL